MSNVAQDSMTSGIGLLHRFLGCATDFWVAQSTRASNSCHVCIMRVDLEIRVAEVHQRVSWGLGLLNLRLNQLHLSLTHEVQCWTAIGSGIKNGDDGSSRSGKTSLQTQPNGRAPKGMLWDDKCGSARTLSGIDIKIGVYLLGG